MKISKLYIKKCGVFDNILIDFSQNNNPDLICLSGVNGSGKTTIMDLILNLTNFLNPKLTLQDIDFDRLKPQILTRTEFAQLDIIINNKILSIVLGDTKYTQRYKNNQAFYFISSKIIKIIRRFEVSVVKISIQEKDELKTNLKDFETFYFDSNSINSLIIKENTEIIEDFLQIIDDNIDQVLNHFNSTLLPSLFFFNSGDREIMDIRYKSIPKEDTQYQVTMTYHPLANDIKKLLIYYDYAYPEIFEDLKKWINKNILEGKEIYKINRPDFQVVIRNKNGDEHSLELLSSGEESLLIIAVQLYLKTTNNSVILIDEIDHSLHPEYQKKIMRLIRDINKTKKSQIIVSSHSRFIWNFFDEKSIIRLTEVIK